MVCLMPIVPVILCLRVASLWPDLLCSCFTLYLFTFHFYATQYFLEVSSCIAERICHLPYVQADLHYDYGADYYFLVKEVETEGK